MDTTNKVVAEYRRLRALGFQAWTALHSARTNVAFEDKEDDGLVRMRIVSDDSPDLSFLDQECFSDIRRQQLNRANDDGCWGIVSEVKCPCCGEWTEADSVWGFIADDWKDSGYDSDVKADALAKLAESKRAA